MTKCVTFSAPPLAAKRGGIARATAAALHGPHPYPIDCVSALQRTRDAVDLPDLSGEGDDVRGAPDELERGRLVQTVYDEGEGAVRVDLDERAGVVQRRSSRRAADRKDTLREGVKTVAGAKFHVNEEAS